MRKKKKRRQVPPISSLPRELQRDLHNALALALIRGLTVHILSNEMVPLVNEEDRGRKSIRAIARVEATPIMRGLQAAWLFFASVEVAMELWVKRGFHDPEIDELVKDPRREILKGFRDTVFHPPPMNDDRINAFYNEWDEVEAWASGTFDKMLLYTRKWFEDYGAMLRAERAAREI